MSPKELLYIEDALGHEQFLKTKCCNTAQSLTDAELKQMVDQMSSQHQNIFNQFYNLV